MCSPEFEYDYTYVNVNLEINDRYRIEFWRYDHPLCGDGMCQVNLYDKQDAKRNLMYCEGAGGSTDGCCPGFTDDEYLALFRLAFSNMLPVKQPVKQSLSPWQTLCCFAHTTFRDNLLFWNGLDNTIFHKLRDIYVSAKDHDKNPWPQDTIKEQLETSLSRVFGKYQMWTIYIVEYLIAPDIYNKTSIYHKTLNMLYPPPMLIPVSYLDSVKEPDQALIDDFPVYSDLKLLLYTSMKKRKRCT